MQEVSNIEEIQTNGAEEALLHKKTVDQVLDHLKEKVDPEIFDRLKIASSSVLYLLGKYRVPLDFINLDEDGNFEKITLMNCLFDEWSNKTKFSERKILIRQLFELIPEYSLFNYNEFKLSDSSLMKKEMVKYLWPESEGKFSWLKQNNIDKDGIIVLPYLSKVNKKHHKSHIKFQSQMYDLLNTPKDQRIYAEAFAVPSQSLIFIFEDSDESILNHEKFHVSYPGHRVNKLGKILDEGMTEINSQKMTNGSVDYECSSYLDDINILRTLVEKNPKLERFLDERYRNYNFYTASNLSGELLNTIGIKGYLSLYSGTNDIESATLNEDDTDKFYEKTGLITTSRLRDMVDFDNYDFYDVKNEVGYVEVEYGVLDGFEDLFQRLDQFAKNFIVDKVK